MLMEVLVVMPEQLPVPPILGGSVESAMHNVFRRMARTDSVRMISVSHPRLPTVSRLQGGRYTIHRIPYANRRKAYLRAAVRKAKTLSFDILQIENRPTFVAAFRKAFPEAKIVLSLHSLTFMSRLTKKEAYRVLRQTDAVVTVVSFLAESMRKKYPKYAHKFHSAILGVDTDQFRPRTEQYRRKLRRKWKVDGGFNVLFVGRIVPKKGLHTLVRAVAEVKRSVPRTRLIAVGASWPGRRQETPYMRKVRRLSARLKVPIRFTGYIPPAKVHQAYALGDVFVCPTMYKEGFATVNSEAMASGVPVIASDRGGIREVIVHERTGLLVKAYRSPRAFAGAILRLRREPEAARRLADAARRTAEERLSWNRTVETLRAYYAKWRA